MEWGLFWYATQRGQDFFRSENYQPIKLEFYDPYFKIWKISFLGRKTEKTHQMEQSGFLKKIFQDIKPLFQHKNQEIIQFYSSLKLKKTLIKDVKVVSHNGITRKENCALFQHFAIVSQKKSNEKISFLFSLNKKLLPF